MTRSLLLLSAAACLVANVARAQDTTSTKTEAQVPNQQSAQQTGQSPPEGEIIVTATRRADRVSNVPIAISVLTTASLQNTGAVDIRQLNQLSPSLLVSSTSSESTGGVARIRGIGTVGDNPGLESSVGTFIDGVYRSRSGVALTELGAVERIEVLRGPQGTLFGRNTSAGLINIVTQKPSFETAGDAGFTYGNYNYYRGEFGVTGPILGGDKVAARLDGIIVKRDGFNRDVNTGQRSNGRNRYLVRGQLLIRPTEDLNIRLIGDYAERHEQCCSAVYAPTTDFVRDPATPVGQIGNISLQPSRFAAFERSLTDPAGRPVVLPDTPGKRDVAISPGRDYHSDVIDWGGSGEVNWDLGGVNLTSITAYRLYNVKRGQDADYTNLDLLYRDNFKQQFRTFSQELRAQGEAFHGRLNYLVGGYFANEDLYVRDNLRTGSQFGAFSDFVVSGSSPSLAGFAALGGYERLNNVINGLLLGGGAPPSVAGLFASKVAPLNLSSVGETADNYHQNSRNFAVFTHNQIKLIDTVTLTLGGRFTSEKKKLDATLASDNTSCASILNSANNVAALGAVPGLGATAARIAGTLRALAGLPCVSALNTLVDGTFHSSRTENKFSGTAVLSWKPIDSLLVYGSYSRGYKSGGFNLDRATLALGAPNLDTLQFAPETVDAYEAGLKFSKRRFNANVAFFREDFSDFQLNTFNGTNFVVRNIESCKGPTTVPPGNLFGSCPSGQTRAGVRSQGFELEAGFRPAPVLSVNAGFSYTESRYRTNLTGINGSALDNSFFLLPGNQISNAPEYVLTTSATWTPPIPGTSLSGLVYADTRMNSSYNTGSDLAPEKLQNGYVITNARIGVRGPGQRWSVEFWGQNVFDTYYTQVAFEAPLQAPGGVTGGRVSTLPAGTTYAANRSSELYGRFLGEPRTFGVTLRTKF